jgi:hypothetical protein
LQGHHSDEEVKMELAWRQVITDPKQIDMFRALEDPKWDWRTPAALARESGLTEDQVRAVAAGNPELVRKSAVPSQQGEDLFTLQSRFYERKGPLKKGWDFLSASSSSS